jgi:hypothetical protein
VRRSTSEILSACRGAEEDTNGVACPQANRNSRESVAKPLQGELMVKPGEHVKFTLLSEGTTGWTKGSRPRKANSHSIMSVPKCGKYIVHEVKYTG